MSSTTPKKSPNQGQQQQSKDEDELPNPRHHSCKYCSIKTKKLSASLQFRPSSLRQQTLLRLAYSTFTTDPIHRRQLIDSLNLPTNLLDEIDVIQNEIDLWDSETKNLYKMVGQRSRGLFCRREMGGDYDRSLEWTGHRCFITDLHWKSNTHAIDRRATAEMIIRCALGVDPKHEFLLAAANCVESEATRLWPLISPEIRDRWTTGYHGFYTTSNPIFLYWTSKLTSNQTGVSRALDEIAHRFVHSGDHRFEMFKYFWPLIVENYGGITHDKVRRLFDHVFHQSISASARAITYFVWHQAPPTYYQSMVSASRCCGAAADYYFSFHKAVENGLHDVVRMMWEHLSKQQHNRILLAEHARAFCKAAEKGYIDIVRLLWEAATPNQRFIMIFEQSCLAFRRACANGHTTIVKMLWEDSPVDKRRKMLTGCDFESVTAACKNGHSNVVQYLWSNLGADLKNLMDSLMEITVMLSKCISETASLSIPSTSVVDKKSPTPKTDGSVGLHFIFSGSTEITRDTQSLLDALLNADGAGLRALLKRAEATDRWDEIVDLFKVFDRPEDRAALRSRMTVVQADLCGFEMGANVEESISSAISTSAGLDVSCNSDYDDFQ